MSKAGIVKLENELKHLKFTERPKIVAEIKRTMELGDLSENAEYHAAKESQKHIERKLAELELTLSKVQVVDIDAIPTDRVYLFANVIVKDESDGEEIEFKIVPPGEDDAMNDIISVQSPIGKALLGKKEGDFAEISVPAGIIKYRIIKIYRD